jgi:hypothetical protein
MLKRLVISLSVISITLLIACSPTRVIKQTETSAIIQGIGVTKVEAKINAETKAGELFGKFKQVKEPDYSQEYDVDYDAKTGKGDGSTYWSCVIEVEKVK